MSRAPKTYRKKPNAPLPQSVTTVAQLMTYHNLSEEQASVVRYDVPLRGTHEWDRRERLRIRAGGHCYSVDAL